MANGVGQSVPLPGELALTRLAGRFVVAEERIRQLLARAPAGDRRRLLELALEVLLDLRREVTRSAVAGTLAAYATASLATSLLTGRPAPARARAHDLGRGLALGLTRALTSAEDGSRTAFATVSADRVWDAQREALTARVDRRGARQQLAAEATMRTSTVARHATSRATADTLGHGGLVTIEGGSGAKCNMNGICDAFEGQTLALGDPGTRLPPYHPSCGHEAVPAGFDLADVAGAQREASG